MDQTELSAPQSGNEIELNLKDFDLSIISIDIKNETFNRIINTDTIKKILALEISDRIKVDNNAINSRNFSVSTALKDIGENTESLMSKLKVDILSGLNTDDETEGTIITKLGHGLVKENNTYILSNTYNKVGSFSFTPGNIGIWIDTGGNLYQRIA